MLKLLNINLQTSTRDARVTFIHSLAPSLALMTIRIQLSGGYRFWGGGGARMVGVAGGGVGFWPDTKSGGVLSVYGPIRGAGGGGGGVLSVYGPKRRAGGGGGGGVLSDSGPKRRAGGGGVLLVSGPIRRAGGGGGGV